MATFQITDNKTGHVYEITGPDDATEDEIMQYAQNQFDSQKEPISWSDVPGKAISNLPKSAGDFTRQITTAIAHPVDTASGLLDAAAGGLYNALPKKLSAYIYEHEPNKKALDRAIKTADAIGEEYKKNYGSEEGIKNKIASDPVGVLSDAAMLAGGAGAITKSGKVSRLANLIDPITPIAKGVETAARVTKPLAKGTGSIVDLVTGNRPKVKARNIAREAAGDNISAIRAANEAAPESLTAGQAAYGINQDTWQALSDLAQKSDKSSFYRVKADELRNNQLSDLAQVAGGRTQAAAKSSRVASKSRLSELTNPMRESALSKANIAGKIQPKLERELSSLEQMASNKVEDARRFNAAGERAQARADSNYPVEGYPRTPGKYTYMDELRQRAEQVVNKSAKDSLAYGEAARFKEYQLESLKQSGLSPLTSNQIVSSIKKSLKNPEIGVDDLNRAVLNNVANKLKQWTDKGTGVIDASALYEIRKSAINSEIERLLPNADARTKSVRAASLLAQVKPLIDNAIERAGGSGWKDYLKTYEDGIQKINQTKLASKAIDMFNDSPESFIKLVNGDDVKAIEKVFGPNSYDIVKEMGSNLAPLRKVSSELERDIAIGKQAKSGARGLSRILDNNNSKIRVPFVGAKARAANEVLNNLQDKVSSKTLDVIVEGMKSGKSANEMLDAVPAVDRYKVLKYLNSDNSRLKSLLSNKTIRNAARNSEALTKNNED